MDALLDEAGVRPADWRMGPAEVSFDIEAQRATPEWHRNGGAVVELVVAHPSSPANLYTAPATVLTLRADCPDVRDPAKLRAALAVHPSTWATGPKGGRVSVPVTFQATEFPKGTATGKALQRRSSWWTVPSWGRPPATAVEATAGAPQRIRVVLPGYGPVDAVLSQASSSTAEVVYIASSASVHMALSRRAGAR